MARLSRACPAGIPQHIIQRGNNKQLCFTSNQDYTAYRNWLAAYAHKYQVDIHAWVLMPDHVHLLCTPWAENAVSQMMQAIGRQYVRYFNASYQRTGTLWEGRFRSCLIQPEPYLLQIYRYIELNPVRAGLVRHAAEYRWSSYQENALGSSEALCKPHLLYLMLGDDTAEQQANYLDFFHLQTPDQQLLNGIRSSVNQGMVLGSELFAVEVEKLTGRRMQKKSAGRPVGSRSKLLLFDTGE